MKELRFAPEAVHDLTRLRAFLEEKNPAAAKRAAARILQVAAVLVAHPELGRAVDDADVPDLREVLAPFGSGAYVLRYRIDDETVVVARVWHSREQRE
jgi:plasmid stabilization system protein ParE